MCEQIVDSLRSSCVCVCVLPWLYQCRHGAVVVLRSPPEAQAWSDTCHGRPSATRTATRTAMALRKLSAGSARPRRRARRRCARCSRGPRCSRSRRRCAVEAGHASGSGLAGHPDEGGSAQRWMRAWELCLRTRMTTPQFIIRCLSRRLLLSRLLGGAGPGCVGPTGGGATRKEMSRDGDPASTDPIFAPIRTL